MQIQEAHPLKQGLKLGMQTTPMKFMPIQEAHPLKQGLKHPPVPGKSSGGVNSRGTSIKTRIETIPLSRYGFSFSIQEAHPLKQGLKTINYYAAVNGAYN